MKQFRLLLLLALLMTAATGAWATTPNSIVINGTPQVGDKSISLTYHFDPNNVPGITGYAPTLKVKCAADNKWDEMTLSLHEVSSGTTNISLSNLGEFEAGKTYEVCFAYNNGNWVDDVFQSFVPAAAGYSVTLKDGVKDADKWTVKVGDGEAQALPIGGLKGDGSETVTLQYSGRLKVKGVKATSDEAAKPAAEGHALSASAVGEIVGSDGKAYAAADKDNLPKGVKAEALVCYVDGEHGLALAMADVKDAKMSWDNNRGANDGKTAAEWCTGWNTSHPITGATWLLASKTQWNNMISAAGGASNLSNAFSAVGGTNLQAFSYWSSTPNIGTSAWRYYFPSSSWSWTYLNQDNTGSFIRACLEW